MANINLLEKNLQKILRSAGFDPELRVNLNGYEIDVFVEYKSEQIVFECKQYQRGNLTVRNLIHQWSGKQEEIEVDRVVLVLVGVSVNEEAYELAEQRDIKIWQGEKVDTLLDDVVDGTQNLREKILLDLDLDSDEEIEAKIEEVMDSYRVDRKTAVEYLRDEISKSNLERQLYLQKELEDAFSDGLDFFSDRDIRRYRNDETYYGKPFREVVLKMAELGIKDKKIARLFVGDTGGTAHGERYSKRKVKKIEFIVENFGVDFEKAKVFISSVKSSSQTYDAKPKMKTLRRAANVKSDRPDLELEEIYDFLKEGFNVREIKKGEAERDEQLGEEEEKQSSSEDSSSDTDEDEKDGDEEEIPTINSSGELVTSEEEGHPPITPSNEKTEKDESETATALVVVGLILLVVLLFALLG